MIHGKEIEARSEGSEGLGESEPNLRRRLFLTSLGAGLMAAACAGAEEAQKEGSQSEALCAAWPAPGVVVITSTNPNYLRVGTPAGLDAYLIPAGVSVTLCADATVGMLIIEGTLELDPNTTVTLKSWGNVIVRGSGILRMRPASVAIAHTLQFTQIDETLFQGGMVMPPLDPAASNVRNDVGLWVTEQGVLDLQGTPRGDGTTSSMTWKRSASYDPTYPNWRAGDTVVRAPVADKASATDTAYLRFTFGKWPVAAGTPPKATTYDRSGAAIDYYAEVFNLTRNVIIRGEGEGSVDLAPADPAGWSSTVPNGATATVATNHRAHVMFVGCTVPQTIKYVRLQHLGPRMADPAMVNPTVLVPGRYALHFHMCDNNMACSTVEGVVSVLCGNHCFVPHKTHGITFHDCIAFSCFETAFWWDAPSGTELNGSDRITYDHCAGLSLLCDPSFRGYDTYAFSLGQAATPDLTNRCTDCVAVGSMGNSSGGGFTWPGIANLKPNAWVFDNCVTHNNKSVGVYVWQNDPKDHFLTRLTAYNNGGGGISHGAYGNKYTYDGLQVFGAWGVIGVSAVAHHGGAMPNQIQFTNSVFDGAGATSCFVLAHHFANASAENPCLIKDCTFRGAPPGTAVYAYETSNSGTLPGFFDFLNVTVIDSSGTHELMPSDFANLATGAVAGSIFRIQHSDGSSWQYTSGSWTSLGAVNVITSDSRYQPRAVPPTPPPVTCTG